MKNSQGDLADLRCRSSCKFSWELTSLPVLETRPSGRESLYQRSEAKKSEPSVSRKTSRVRTLLEQELPQRRWMEVGGSTAENSGSPTVRLLISLRGWQP